MRSYVIESDKEKVTTVEPVDPKGFRAAWLVLRGQYKVELVKKSRITLYGFNQELKKTWTRSALMEEHRLFFGTEQPLVEKPAPIKKRVRRS